MNNPPPDPNNARNVRARVDQGVRPALPDRASGGGAAAPRVADAADDGDIIEIDANPLAQVAATVFGRDFRGVAAMAAAAAAAIVRTGLPPAVVAAGGELLEPREIAELFVVHIEEFLGTARRLLHRVGRALPGDEFTGGIKMLELTAAPVRLADPHAPGAAAAADAIIAAFLEEDLALLRADVAEVRAALRPRVVERLPPRAWHRGPGLDGHVLAVEMGTPGIVDDRAPDVAPGTFLVHRLPPLEDVAFLDQRHRVLQAADFTITLRERVRDYPPDVRPPPRLRGRAAGVPPSRWPDDAARVPIVGDAFAALRDGPLSPLGPSPLGLNLASIESLSRRGAGTRFPVEVMDAIGLARPALGSSVDARAVVVLLNSNGVDPPTAAWIVDEPMDVSFDRAGVRGPHIALANWQPKVTLRGTHEVADLLGTKYPSPYMADRYAMSLVPTATLPPALREFGAVADAHLLLVLEPLAPEPVQPYVAASFGRHLAPVLNGMERVFGRVGLSPPLQARVERGRGRAYHPYNSLAVVDDGTGTWRTILPDGLLFDQRDPPQPTIRSVPGPLTGSAPVRVRGFVVVAPATATRAADVRMSTRIDVLTIHLDGPSFRLYLTHLIGPPAPDGHAVRALLGDRFDPATLRVSFTLPRLTHGMPPDADPARAVDLFAFFAPNQAGFGLPPAGALAGALPLPAAAAAALVNPGLMRANLHWYRVTPVGRRGVWTQNPNFLAICRAALSRRRPVLGDVLPVHVALFAGAGPAQVINAEISFQRIGRSYGWVGFVGRPSPGVDSVDTVLNAFLGTLTPAQRALGVADHYSVARDGVTPVIAFHVASRNWLDPATSFWRERRAGRVVPPDGWPDA